MAFGTLMVGDLIRSSNQNILNFGQGDLYDYLTKILLPTYEQQLSDELDLFSMPTTERIMGYGGSSGMQMVETDESGRADVSKPVPGGNIGIPLRLYQVGVQWTRKWLENHTPEDMMGVVTDVILTDTQNLHKAVRNAFFLSTNYSWTDHLIDNYSLSVKRLANNDGFAYPPDPYGNAIAGSHNHYLARVSTLAASDVDAVVNTVAEHYIRGQVRLYIPFGLDATIRGFNAAGQFIAEVPTTQRTADTVTIGTGSLDTSQINNRRIGYWGNQGAEVWVKPWVPANYMLAFMTNYGNKVLCKRVRNDGGGNLRIVVESSTDPLQTKAWEREVGFGVCDRLGAAALYTGGTSWVDPVI
jgi:hypothetical protein